MIRLAPPAIDATDLRAVTEVLETGWLSGGPALVAFERAVAEASGATEAVAVSSGTAALVLALQVAGVGSGDEVIVPSFSYIATAHAVTLTGAQPVLVDVSADTWNIDPAAVSAAVTSRTRIIVPVHQFGLPADLDGETFCGVPLVEDAACALGAERDGFPCSASARFACLSFHPRKVITTGEGGAVLTRDPAIAARLRQLRNHGRDDAGRFVVAGGNFRLSALGAALGRSQLARLADFLQRRRELAACYRARLGDLEQLALQRADPGHAYQTFAVALVGAADAARRDQIIAQLREQGIEAGIATTAAHRELPYRDDPRAVRGELPTSEWLAQNGLALPLHPRLTTDEVERVCGALLRILQS